MSEHQQGYLPGLFASISNLEHQLHTAQAEVVLLREDNKRAWDEVRRLIDTLSKYEELFTEEAE